jgi:hypothetical protein
MAMDYLDDGEDAKQEIYKRYKNKLVSLGVNLYHSEVEEAIESCFYDFETYLRAFILWAAILEEKEGKLPSHPDDALVKAIRQPWKLPDYNLSFPDNMARCGLISPGQKWWKAAGDALGLEVRDKLIYKVVESYHEDYVWFHNRRTLQLNIAMKWKWNQISEYGKIE